MGFTEMGRPTFSALPLLNHQYRGKGPGARGWAWGSSGDARPNECGMCCWVGAESQLLMSGCVIMCGCTDVSDTEQI